MKFYVITYPDEGRPESIGYEFAQSLKEAKKKAAQIKRDTKEHWLEKIKGLREEGDDNGARSLAECMNDEIESIHIEVIEIPNGTVKERLFWALKYQVV